MSDTSKPTLLCVDTTGALLSNLSLTLRHQYEVTSTRSCAEALHLLVHGPEPSAVIADVDGGELSGAQFFTRVKAAAPTAARVLVTERADADSLLAAINEGSVLRVVRKPCAGVNVLSHLGAAVGHNRALGASHAQSSPLSVVEQLAAVGKTAGEVGHDINNLTLVLSAVMPLVAEHAANGRPIPDSYLARLLDLGDRLAAHGACLMNVYRQAREATRDDLAPVCAAG